jgi:hypothetical protein
VSVTTAGGTNNGFTYTYVDVPTVASFAPGSDPASGGTAVTITGTSLSSTQSVTFGSQWVAGLNRGGPLPTPGDTSGTASLRGDPLSICRRLVFPVRRAMTEPPASGLR